MEAAAAFASARLFTTASRIHSLKVISDTLSAKIPTKEFVSNLIEKHCKSLSDWIQDLQASDFYQQTFFTAEEETLLEDVRSSAKLTFSQKVSFLNKAKWYKSSFDSLPDSLSKFIVEPSSTNERHMLFEHIQACFETK